MRAVLRRCKYYLHKHSEWRSGGNLDCGYGRYGALERCGRRYDASHEFDGDGCDDYAELTAQTTGALSYTGTTVINLGGNVTTSGGVVTFTGPTALTANAIVDTTNAGGTVAGANISFSSTLNSAIRGSLPVERAVRAL